MRYNHHICDQALKPQLEEKEGELAALRERFESMKNKAKEVMTEQKAQITEAGPCQKRTLSPFRAPRFLKKKT